MKKYALIVLSFVISFFSLTIVVFATYYSNMNKSYYFTIDESYVNLDEPIDSSDHRLKNLVSSIKQLNPNYNYSINVTYTNRVLSSIHVYVYETIDSYDNALFGFNATSSSIKGAFQSNLSQTAFNSDGYLIPLNTSNYLESTEYIALKDCLVSDQCNFRSGAGASGYTYRYTTNNPFISNSDYTVTPFTNSTYDMVLYSTVDLLYTEYSSNMLQPNICNSSSFQCYYKKVYLNDVLLETGDKIPSYYDLFVQEEPDSSNFKRYTDKLAYVMVGNIPKANINNFKITLDFNYSDENYLESLTYTPYYFGRVNHGSYYTYEPIDCTPNSTYSSFTTDGVHVSGYLYPTGFSCSSNLSPYDNISLRLDVLPSENTYDSTGYVNSLTYNLNISSNYGYITNELRTPSYYIIDRFTNLPSDFGIIISTNLPVGYADASSDDINPYLIKRLVDKTTNQTKDYFDSLNTQFGTITNTNLFIYNNSNLNPTNTNLTLWLYNEDIIVSFKDSNNQYTYYDDSGNISNGTFTKDFYVSQSNDYDISSYFDIVLNYIDSLNEDIYNLSTVIQDGYDRIPEPFSTVLFIFFILSCLYFIIKLIKGD